MKIFGPISGRTSPTRWTGSARAGVACEKNGHVILIVRSCVMMVWVEEVAKTTIFGDGITAEDMVRNSFKKFIARSSKTMISSLSVYAQEMLFFRLSITL